MAKQAVYSESILHELWQCQRLPPNLVTTDGETVEVVNPGVHNHDAGPDFLQATLRVDGRLMQGEVELHLNAEDWQHHGHHRDPAYNSVEIHLAVRELTPATALFMQHESGLPVRQVMLPLAVLDTPAAKQLELLDCPLSRTSPEKICGTVRQAGALRLAAKAATFAEQIANQSWDQAVYRGLAEAAGYAKNQESFRKLADSVTIELLFGELRAAQERNQHVRLEALLFGAAGFLSKWVFPEDLPNAAIRDFVTERRLLWQQLKHTLQIRPMREEEWRYFRLRPQNFPPRRLAGLAAIVLKFHRDGILEHLSALLQALAPDANAAVRELLNYFIVPAHGIWQSYFGFRERTASLRSRPGDLIGRARALDMLINIIVPSLWLYFREAGDAVLSNFAQEIYANLPKLQENEVTRSMRRQLSQTHAVSRKVAAKALSQQGLIHLHKLYCRPLRCDVCLALTPGASKV